MDDYLTKPVKAQQLYEVIERLTRNHDALEREGSVSLSEETYAVRAVEHLDLAAMMATAEQFGTDEELFREIAEIFLDEHETDLKKIREAIARHDSESLASGAHSLKGTVGNFHAESARRLAQRLEVLGQ